MAVMVSTAHALPPAAPAPSRQNHGGALVAPDSRSEWEPSRSDTPALEGAGWEGYYLDPERGPAPFAPEYERWFDSTLRPARYGRAISGAFANRTLDGQKLGESASSYAALALSLSGHFDLY
jgi:hypothetical protein